MSRITATIMVSNQDPFFHFSSFEQFPGTARAGGVATRDICQWSMGHLSFLGWKWLSIRSLCLHHAICVGDSVYEWVEWTPQAITALGTPSCSGYGWWTWSWGKRLANEMDTRDLAIVSKYIHNNDLQWRSLLKSYTKTLLGMIAGLNWWSKTYIASMD